MSYREPAGTRTWHLPHPDKVLYDPLPGQATREAWAAVLFDRDLEALSAARQRQRDFRAKDFC